MVIHLTGVDLYRSAQRLAELRSAFITKHDPQSLNTVALDGVTMTVADLHTALTATGFFAAKRFVAIDRYDATSAAVGPAELVSALTPYATAAAEVIVVLRDVTPEPVRKPVRTTKKRAGLRADRGRVTLPKAKLETFPQLTDSQAATWLTAEAKAIGGTLTPPVALRLVTLCGGDTWRMASEIRKLIDYAAGRAMTVTDVETLVRSDYSSDIFALTDAIGQRQTARALELLHRELAIGTNVFGLIATLGTHLYHLWQVKLARDRGLPPAAMAGELGLHPFVVQKALLQSAQFSPDQLRLLHHRLLTIDHDLKSSPLDAETLLDLLLVKG